MRLLVSASLAIGFALAFPHPSSARVAPDQVPTFQIRGRVLYVGSPTNTVGKHPLSLVRGVSATATNTDWSPWIPFDRKAAELAVGPNSYPNNYMRGFPVVLHLSVGGPVVDPTPIEVELQFDGSNAAVQPMSATLYRGSLGILLWRDAGQRPQAATMAEYNKRYWAAFGSAGGATARAKHFPIVDRFISGDGDRNALKDGIEQLVRGGFNGIMLGADPLSRKLLLGTGLRRTASAVYNPPGYAFDHSTSVTEAVIAKWADDQIAPYLKAGYERTDLSVFAMSDEPGWYFPAAFGPLTNNPVALARFREYLGAQGLKPKDVGAKDWSTVFPIGRAQAADLPSKRLFYWTTRFFPWDSARHFARCTRALEAATYTNLPILVNWNFFSGRFYVPGPVAHNSAKQDPNAAMGGHDWLEFGRMRGCTMLWTEDWFGDGLAYQWSYYCARLRSAAELGGVEFGGYVIPRTAGDRTNGIVQKIVTIAGSGGKCLKYFVFGPEYNFPGNCYSEKSRLLPKMAEAHAMIAAAEPLLWPGRRPRPQVAILMPRSAMPWDAKKIAIVNQIQDVTNVRLNHGTVDYLAEVYNLYVALQHANIPVDIVDEDDLKPEKLAAYRVLYVTEPNVPAEGQSGLVEWTRQGGILATVSGAAARDRYDEPCSALADGTGIVEPGREPFLVAGPTNFQAIAASGTGACGDFAAVCVRGSLAGRDLTIEGKFEDGTPAVVRRAVGRGQALRYAWMPGLSYAATGTNSTDGLPTGWSESIRKWILLPVAVAGLTPPVSVDRPLIETPILTSDAGSVVTILNWSGVPVDALKVIVHPGFAVKRVESVKSGKLQFETTEGGIRFVLPVDAADFVMLWK